MVEVWLRSVYNERQFTWKTKYLFVRTSTSIGGIFPDNSHAIFSTHTQQTMEVWLQLVRGEHRPFSAVSQLPLELFPVKFIPRNSQHVGYKRRKFWWDRSTINSALLQQQCAFSAVSRLPSEGCSLQLITGTLGACSTFEAILVGIGQ
jgi:hypothetical protein